MKKTNTRNSIQKLISLIILIFMLALVNTTKAGPDLGKEPDSAPVDGGLSLVIAAGVGYTVKRLRHKK